MFGSSRKDAIFYEAFREQAKIAVEAAEGLLAIFDDLASSERRGAVITQERKRADSILRKTVHQLHSTWITPLDRHQIHELVVGLDKVVALVDATASRVSLFAIRETRPEAKSLARDVTECSKRVREATELLPKLGKDQATRVMGLAGEIHELEGSADETHRRALATLFDGSTNPLAVMKWREIFDNLEEATNLCRDISKLFEGIVLENA